MGGGLMQLVAYGAQDIYLTGNPQITFFKVVYRRHTNFAIEAIEQCFQGTCDFGKRVCAVISRNGDLINHTYLQVTLPALSTTNVGGGATTVGWTNAVGHALVKSVELEIGGQRIDKQYGVWFEIWTELTLPAEKLDGYNEMIGRFAAAVSLETNALTAKVYLYSSLFLLQSQSGTFTSSDCSSIPRSSSYL